MAVDLDAALAVRVHGQRLGDMPPSALRILKLWNRNRLTAAPDDAKLLLLESQIEAVLTHRRLHPLPRPTFVHGFDPPEVP